MDIVLVQNSPLMEKKMFQNSTFDLERYVDIKGYTEDQIEKFHSDGTIMRWLENKRNIHVVFQDPTTGWKRGESRRTGLIVRKVGMKTSVDYWGRAFAATVLFVEDNQVIQQKQNRGPGRAFLQIGAGYKSIKQLNAKQIGHFAHSGVPYAKQKLVEYEITPDALIPTGTTLYAQHFVPGQFVDVSGITKGKGFQGAVKRWGFAGGPASHGSSKFHRKLGSTGQRQDPGKVWKGKKKMAGHMGAQRRTFKQLRVMKINTLAQTIELRGQVPGPKKGWIEIRDSRTKPHDKPPPFPTWKSTGEKQRIALRYQFRDPYWKIRTTDWDLKFAEAMKAMKSAQLAEGALDGTGTESILENQMEQKTK